MAIPSLFHIPYPDPYIWRASVHRGASWDGRGAATKRRLTLPYRGGFTMPTMIEPTNRQSGSLMTIGEASRRSGFTIKALRFYERRGLLPRASRGPNGYRVYDEKDLGRLSFIRDAKTLGLTLG